MWWRCCNRSLDEGDGVVIIAVVWGVEVDIKDFVFVCDDGDGAVVVLIMCCCFGACSGLSVDVVCGGVVG